MFAVFVDDILNPNPPIAETEPGASAFLKRFIFVPILVGLKLSCVLYPKINC